MNGERDVPVAVAADFGDYLRELADARCQDLAELLRDLELQSDVMVAGAATAPGRETPALSFAAVRKALARMPTTEELRQRPSTIYAALTTTMNIELHVLSCEPKRTVLGALGLLVLPGEEQELARVTGFALWPLGEQCVFTTLELYEDMLRDPSPDKAAHPFPVHALEIRPAPGTEN